MAWTKPPPKRVRTRAFRCSRRMTVSSPARRGLASSTTGPAPKSLVTVSVTPPGGAPPPRPPPPEGPVGCAGGGPPPRVAGLVAPPRAPAGGGGPDLEGEGAGALAARAEGRPAGAVERCEHGEGRRGGAAAAVHARRAGAHG